MSPLDPASTIVCCFRAPNIYFSLLSCMSHHSCITTKTPHYVFLSTFLIGQVLFPYNWEYCTGIAGVFQDDPHFLRIYAVEGHPAVKIKHFHSSVMFSVFSTIHFKCAMCSLGHLSLLTPDCSFRSMTSFVCW